MIEPAGTHPNFGIADAKHFGQSLYMEGRPPGRASFLDQTYPL